MIFIELVFWGCVEKWNKRGVMEEGGFVILVGKNSHSTDVFPDDLF